MYADVADFHRNPTMAGHFELDEEDFRSDLVADSRG